MSEVVSVKRDLQRHYNASGIFTIHILNTLDHTFPIHKSAYKSLKLGDSIEYSISPIFQKINWYRPFQFGDGVFTTLDVRFITTCFDVNFYAFGLLTQK